MCESGFPEPFVFLGLSAFNLPIWQGGGCHTNLAFKANGLTLTLQDEEGLGTTNSRKHNSADPRMPRGSGGPRGGGSVLHFVPRPTLSSPRIENVHMKNI